MFEMGANRRRGCSRRIEVGADRRRGGVENTVKVDANRSRCHRRKGG